MTFSIIIFIYGIVFNNPFILPNEEKAIFGIFLYSIPLIFQISKYSKTIKIYSIWFGIFMILQSILLFFTLNNKDYITLIPNLDRTVNIQTGALAGISGIQRIISDEKGFRNTKKINYLTKNDKEFRIFAIGGSTTEQIYLDQKKTWTHLLQKQLDEKYNNLDFQVINTGVSGLRAVNHIATLNKITKYHPDIVIFLIGFNDWNNHIKENFEYNKKSNYEKFINNLPKFITDLSYQKTLGIYLKTSKIKLIFNKNEKNNDNYKELTKNYFPAGSLFKKDVRRFKPKDVLQNYKDQLSEINFICDENKIKCIFLTQPNGYKKQANNEYKKLFWLTPPEKNFTLNFDSLIHISKLYNNYMIKFSSKNNKISCDLDSKILASSKHMYDDAHYNIEGAKVFSKALFNCINKNSIINK
tara:strand:+ start:2547 stop:3785 length:1239 start_codon:yes stop_codon:yes gene_type:complete